MRTTVTLDNGVAMLVKQVGDEVTIEFLGSAVNILELTKEIGDQVTTAIVLDVTRTR